MPIFDRTTDEQPDRLLRSYGILFWCSLILGVLAKAIYRPRIYANHINDFHIADSAPNFFFVIGIMFLMLYVYRKKGRSITSWKMIQQGTLGALFYEFIQLADGGTFDYFDIAASLLGAAVAYFVNQYLVERYANID
ncbi:MAG TPA: hypothetical protein VK141_03045 [Nitrosomonas sp.]|nr:hypothetical protein [Nitrosomonas sp.]